MSTPIGPHVVSWVNPTSRVDGSAYGQADNAGYQLSIDNQAAVSVPLAWGTSFDMAGLAPFQALDHGSHQVTVAVVAKDGTVSAPSSAATFQIVAPPNSPTSVQVA